MIGDLLFYLFAIILVIFGLQVVTTKNLFHSVMSAFAVLLATAGLFFLLNAEFLGIVQILIYAGAVTILVLFVVMLTTAGPRYKITWEPPYSPWLILFALLFLAGLIFAIVSIQWPVAQPVVLKQVTHQLSYRIFLDYLLPFEVASVLILAGLIGAIVIARRDS